MRDYLFRGKRKDNGEWVYGDYSILNEYDGKPHPAIWINATLNYKVIPETVGQYTGLTDKNGTKIFEGDIVGTDIARPYLIVEFRDGCFMFNCNDGGDDYYDIMLPILKDAQTQYEYGEVIGNIHDNPELIGKEGE